MKLHLFGASGTGVSPLGEALAVELSVPYFDTDAYFWQATDPLLPSGRRRPCATLC